MTWSGTLHIGNLCNNNYKLCLALRAAGVDAHYAHFERLARIHPMGDPLQYDPRFNPTVDWVHVVAERSRRRLPQLLFEMSELRRLLRRQSGKLWPHGQTDFPAYVGFFTRQYSAHSTGSDLRVEYGRRGWRGAMMRRGYRRSTVAFFNNIDLHQHDVGRHTSQVFLPNAVDPAQYRIGTEKTRESGERLRLLIPGRITLQTPGDVKGSAVLVDALHRAVGGGLVADLVLASEDPQSAAVVEAVTSLAPAIHVRRCPFRSDRQEYLRQVQAADVVIDQFGLGALGGTALDCFIMGRIALVHLDPVASKACYGETLPLGDLASADQVARLLVQLQEPQQRFRLEAELQAWAMQHHAPDRVATVFLEALLAQGVQIAHTSGVN